MGRVIKGWRNLSIRVTFMIYMLVFVLLAGLLSMITITGAGQIRNNMFLKYNPSYTSADIENPAIVFNMKDFNTDYSYTDEQIIKFCGFWIPGPF